MAPMPSSMPELVSKLTTSLETASHALPSPESAIPPQNGISVLDVKSEVFVSYLQNLAFLILIKIRNAPSEKGENSPSLSWDVVQKLVELRVYLEKGVRPLENKLKYQIEKIVRAADAAERNAGPRATNGPSQINGRGDNEDDSAEDDSDKDSVSDDEESLADSIDELAYRPNLAAFTNGVDKKTATKSKDASSVSNSNSNQVYRPPRITPTALPSNLNADDQNRRTSRKPQRSNTIDEYIASEISTAPVAEPSIGSTITAGGRRIKSAKEQREEDERTAYEEANYVRLPTLSRKEKAKRRPDRGDGFGGEELQGLGQGVDRINRLTSKKRSLGGTGRDIQDGPRGEGFETNGRRGKKNRRF